MDGVFDVVDAEQVFRQPGAAEIPLALDHQDRLAAAALMDRFEDRNEPGTDKDEIVNLAASGHCAVVGRHAAGAHSMTEIGRKGLLPSTFLRIPSEIWPRALALVTSVARLRE